MTRLANEMTGATSSGTNPACWVESGVVHAVAGGYLEDPTITVTWRGTVVPVTWAASYTPNEGDVVLLLVQPPSLILIDKLLGPNLETDE